MSSVLPRRARPTLAAAVLAVVATWPAHAQDLKTMYQLARPYDATLQAAQALVASGEYRVAGAESLFKPQAGLSGSATTGRVDPPIGPSGDAHQLAAQLSARYPLINAANRVAVQKARKSTELDRAELDLTEQDLMVRVAQAYFDVLAAQDALATVRTSKAAITEQLASAKRNFEVGNATIVDAREAQTRYDLAAAQEIAAENDLQTKRIALEQLVGRAGLQPKPIVQPLALPPVLPPDVEAWVGKAAEHPRVRLLETALEVARLDTEQARAGSRPTLDAIGSVGTQYARGSNAATGVPGQARTASVGVQFNWPFYTGGAIDSRVSELSLLEERARQNLEATRRTVAQTARVAFFGLQSGQAQVRALETAEQSAKLALESTQLGYRVGVKVTLDVLNAQTQLFETQRSLAKQRYDVLVNALRLKQAAGTLTERDLDAVNALIAP